MAFRYADSEVYSVQQGQSWVAGRHQFFCSDVTEKGPFHRAAAAAPNPIVYSDPPWTTGQAKQYRTLSDLPPPDYEWTAIFAGVIALAVDIAAPLFLVGDRYSEDVVRSMLPGDRPNYRRYWLEKFGNKNVRAVMHYSGWAAPTPGYGFRELHDQKFPRALLADLSAPMGATLVDPCAGLGAVARGAEQYGCASICNELSPNRLSAAMRKLEKQSGLKPERVA